MVETTLTELRIDTDSEGRTVVRFPPGEWERLRSQLSQTQAESAAMREALMQIAHGLNGDDEDFVAFIDRIARAALSSKAGAALLSELEALREGWNAWEAWGEADGAIIRTTAEQKRINKQRSHMKALSRSVHIARARINALTKETE